MDRKFKKIVAIEPVNMVDRVEEVLKEYSDDVIMYRDIPRNKEEIIKRIGDADAVLVNYTTEIDREILSQVSHVKYIGMCCSLYSEESANVDIACAREYGIEVTGIRDYGDRGVVEYVLYQLIRILHGYDYPCWIEKPLELTRLKIGIIGLGTSGGMIAEALNYMQADVSYYSRTRKPEKEHNGIKYQELTELLKENEVIITCLNKNVILLHEKEFKIMGNGKLMINTSIGPASDMVALKNWIMNPSNIFCCDTREALGNIADEVLNFANVICMNKSAGRTLQSYQLLTDKVIHNIKCYLEND